MISDFLMGIVYMAIVFVLVKPDAHMSQVIGDFSDALSNLVKAAISGSVS